MSKVAAVLLTANPAGATPDDAFLTKIDGRESALRAMELMTNREPISQVMLVIDPAHAEQTKFKLASHLMFMGTKLVQTAGGWFGQLNAALAKLDADVTRVLVHDAARPAVPYIDLESLLATDGPAVALALPLRGTVARADVVPGAGVIEPLKVAEVITPRIYDRAAFETLCQTKAEPSPLQLIEASPLNVRCGESSANLVKAMVALLPKPKVKAATNPFEEAQW